MDEPNMEQEDVLAADAQKEMTPEDYAKAREAAITHLTSEISYLKVEKEYEELLADIEEAKTRRITMIAQRARFYQKQEVPASAPEKEQLGSGDKESIKRKLKEH